MDEAGNRLTVRRLSEGLDEIGGFHDLAAEYVDDPADVVAGIETDRGLWVDALVAAAYQVYAVDPLATSRYRDRHKLSGAKSDAGDARVLADLVRTDRNTDRRNRHRHAQPCLETAIIITAKLIDWRDRWSPDSCPIH